MALACIARAVVRLGASAARRDDDGASVVFAALTMIDCHLPSEFCVGMNALIGLIRGLAIK